MIKKLIKKFLKKEPAPVAENPKNNDIWLASFPRSGVTWMTFLIANIMVKYCKKNKTINFITIHDIIPDIHYKKGKIPKNLGFEPFPRIIKTHSEYLPDYKRAIFIIRDPRDSMVSYYDYLTKKINGPKIDSFSEFLKNNKFGLPSWMRHLKSWIENWSLIIKYEDLKTDPKKEIKKIMELLKIEISENEFNYAIKKSCFENMQAMEKKVGTVKPFQKDFKFVRKGKAGDWKNAFNNQDMDYYQRLAYKNNLQNFLNKNGYLN